MCSIYGDLISTYLALQQLFIYHALVFDNVDGHLVILHECLQLQEKHNVGGNPFKM